jgi:hypothetical protein
VFTPFHKPPYPYPYGRSVDETTTDMTKNGKTIRGTDHQQPLSILEYYGVPQSNKVNMTA